MEAHGVENVLGIAVMIAGRDSLYGRGKSATDPVEEEG